MPAKKNKARRPKSTKTEAQPPLSRTEKDLLWHMAHGYQLETSSRWDNPTLRNLKDGTEVRADANRSTIETLQEAWADRRR